MNKLIKVILAIVGGCSVVMDVLTPLTIALVLRVFFDFSPIVSSTLLIVGGLGSVFRGIKTGGWLKND